MFASAPRKVAFNQLKTPDSTLKTLQSGLLPPPGPAPDPALVRSLTDQQRALHQRLRHERLAIVLLDAQLALELFRDAHHDHDEETGDEWLTIEGLEQFGSRRNLSPSLRPPL